MNSTKTHSVFTPVKLSTNSLPKSVFNVSVNSDLMKQAIVMYWARLKQNTAHTKTRSEVSGGGRKPWRQKGTGRARAGSIRSPLWKGGGITFGPRTHSENAQKISPALRRKALSGALTDRAKDKKVIVVSALTLTVPKTKEALSALAGLPIDEGSILFIDVKADPMLLRATRNLPYTTCRAVAEVNALDVLGHNWVVITQDALPQLEARINPTLTEAQ